MRQLIFSICLFLIAIPAFTQEDTSKTFLPDTATEVIVLDSNYLKSIQPDSNLLEVIADSTPTVDSSMAIDTLAIPDTTAALIPDTLLADTAQMDTIPKMVVKEPTVIRIKPTTHLERPDSLKKLTMRDAVIGQFTNLAPKRIKNLQWVKGRKAFSYVDPDDQGGQLVIQYRDSAQTREVLKLERIRKSHEELASLARFPSITWASENSFVFKQGDTYYEYNLMDKVSFHILKLKPGAANVDFNTENLMAAFTDGNNLKIATIEGDIDVSMDGGNGIVYGQAVHRYEFGIMKGTYWSPSGRYLAYYRKDESMVSEYPLVDITKTPATLTPTRYPMAGDTSHQVKVGIFDVATQRNVFLQVDGPEDQYLTNIAWGPDEKYIYVAILNRDQNHLYLNQYDRITGIVLDTIFEETDTNYVQPLHPIEFIPKRNGEFFWRSERDGYDHIYHYNLQGEMLGQRTAGEWVVQNFLGWNRKKDKFYVTGVTNNGLDVQLFECFTDTLYNRVITPDKGSFGADYDPGSDEFIIHHTSDNEPLVTIVASLNDTTQFELIRNTNPHNGYDVGVTKMVQIPTEDSIMLNARIIYPSDFDLEKRYPVLVYVYNGPGVQLIRNRWHNGAPMWMNLMAANMGYIVFTMDGRGSENRGRDFEQAIFRNLGDVEIADQLRGVDYLKSLPYIDTNRLAVHGWSYGGFMTTSLMLKAPGTFKVGVAGGPVIDWKYYEVMYTERYMDTPQTNPEGYAKASLLDKVENLEGKLLLIHGTIDDVVVPQHSFAFIQRCVQNGIQMDFFPYPMHPHNVRGMDRIHLMNKVIDYIDRNIGDE